MEHCTGKRPGPNIVDVIRPGRRLVVQGMGRLAGLGGALVISGTGGPALAQGAGEGNAIPPDAPIMRPGQRLQRPRGWVEITTFNRSFQQREQESVFKLEFTYLNEHSRDVQLKARDASRLVADGVPRAPVQWFPDSVYVPTESAQDCSVTFRVRGRPRVVHVQFGTGDEDGRNYLRWPD
jgi:hypothetical protein